ncbi:fumarylacetoacetate hydrolase family protein [Sphingomonas sp. RB3P16]|uniref:fumarylacetoacetate hydrolase family protein n=1 Tax=Parasphingomonas frigoris TaxID=3096163 RepID=UPI002FC5997F
MTTTVIPTPQPATVPTQDGQVFPVRRIFCVGRNYADHAREMGSDPDREAPFFFTKPADAVVVSGQPIPYPPRTKDLHHEVELVVAIGTGGADIPPARALEHVWGYAVGIDLTRRDLQAAAKAQRRPWDMAKGFDASAVVGDVASAAVIGHPAAGSIDLSVNGYIRQSSDLAEMIWSVPDLVAELSGFVTLHPGDLIFTGTPAGVGPLEVGDRVRAAIAGVGTFESIIA